MAIQMGVGGCIAAEKVRRTAEKDIWYVSIDGNDLTLELMRKGNTATPYWDILAGCVLS